jgi:filamentous hemagglutinin
MKVRATTYTFDASEQTIDCDLFTSLEAIQLITNVTDNIIIYNFADATKGGTLSGTTLTLTYDTTSMADADKLQILVETGSTTESVSGTVTANLSATDNAVLDAIETDTTTIAGAVDGTEMQVDVVSSALPTGASTAANQTTVIGHLDGVETLLGTIDTDTGNLPTIETNTDFGTVVGGGTETGALRVTIANNSTGVVSVDDNGGAITVDGTVTADLGATDNAVLDAIAASTAAIETAVEGTLTVTGGGGGVEYTEDATDASITGTVAMMEVAGDAIEPLQGTVADGLLVNLGSNNDVTVTGTVDLGATDNAVLDNIDADLTTVIGHVDGIETSLGSIDTKTPALGQALAAASVPVVLTAAQMTTLTPVSTVTANAGTNLNTSALALETTASSIKTAVEIIDNAISGTEMQVDVLTMPTTTVQATNLDIRDLSSASDTVTVHGDVGVVDQLDLTNSNPAAVAIVDGNGDQITSFGGGTQYTEGDTDASITGTALMFESNTGTSAVSVVSNSAPLPISDAGGSLTVDGTVTAELSATDNAVLDTIDAVLDTINAKLVTGTDIGDVTINNAGGAAAVNIQDGGNSITVDGSLTVDLGANNDVTVTSGAITETNSGAIKTAVELLDDAVYADDADWTDNTSKHLLVGGVYNSGGNTVTDGDVAPLSLTAEGGLIVATGSTSLEVDVAGGTVNVSPPDRDITDHTNYARKYYTSAGAATDGIIWSPAVGKRWHVVTMYINVSAAATVTLEDDKAGGDDPVWKGEIAANSGVVLSFTERYPMASGEDAADLTITTTAGNVYCTVVGYEV